MSSTLSWGTVSLSKDAIFCKGWGLKSLLEKKLSFKTVRHFLFYSLICMMSVRGISFLLATVSDIAITITDTTWSKATPIHNTSYRHFKHLGVTTLTPPTSSYVFMKYNQENWKRSGAKTACFGQWMRAQYQINKDYFGLWIKQSCSSRVQNWMWLAVEKLLKNCYTNFTKSYFYIIWQYCF